METKQPNRHDHGDKVSAVKQAKAENSLAVAERRINDRNIGGKFVSKVTDEQWEWALDQIANGALTSITMKTLGVHRSTILDRCERDPEFSERYHRALEKGYFALAEDIRLVTRGEPGFTTGDVRRDELVAKYDLALAKSLANRIFGDKLQVDQRTINITIDRDNADW